MSTSFILSARELKLRCLLSSLDTLIHNIAVVRNLQNIRSKGELATARSLFNIYSYLEILTIFSITVKLKHQKVKTSFCNTINVLNSCYLFITYIIRLTSIFKILSTIFHFLVCKY